jgi:hypothetical protein
VTEDPENVKQEFAFDNPAFKNEGTKVTASPLDTKWTAKLNGSSDKRKTVDDTYANVSFPSLFYKLVYPTNSFFNFVGSSTPFDRFAWI